MLITDEETHCSVSFLDTLQNIASSVYSSFYKVEKDASRQGSNALLEVASGISLKGMENETGYIGNVASAYAYSKSSMSVNWGDSEDYSLTSIDLFDEGQNNLGGLTADGRFQNEDRYIKNAVEGKIIYDAQEAAMQEKWEEYCIRNLRPRENPCLARHDDEQAAGIERTVSHVSIPYSESTASSMSDTEFYKSVEQEKDYVISKSPNLVSEFGLEAGKQYSKEDFLERYFKGHHSFEKEHLKTVKHEDVPKEKTAFWKNRMLFIHGRDDDKSSSWAQKIKGDDRSADSFCKAF